MTLLHRLTIIIYLIETGDPNYVKRGLQYLCELMENHAIIPDDQKINLKKLLSRLQPSEDVLVRRWLYKTIGLIGNRLYTPYLKGQILNVEKDRENLTWAIAALSKIAGYHEVHDTIKKIGENYYGSPFELSSNYFLDKKIVEDIEKIKTIIAKNDILSLQWLSLLYGYHQDSHLRPYSNKQKLIAELNLHDNPHVAEYSVWSIFKSQHGTCSDLEILPQNYDKLPNNVRRWYYRVLTKHTDSIYTNYDLIEHAIFTEKDQAAKEGLSIGLLNHYVDSSFSKIVIKWFESEKNPLIRSHLIQHFVQFSKKEVDFQEIIHFETKNPYDQYTKLLLTNDNNNCPISFQQKITDSSYLKSVNFKEESMEFPLIINDEVKETYFLAIDTVDFTSEVDGIQLRIFKDLLSDISTDEVLKGVDNDKLVMLLTGDGMIICFGSVDYRLLPLKLALSILNTYLQTRKKELRFGICHGPATWLTMNDNTTQIIGNAINWTVRVMSAAGGNSVILCDSYYSTILKPEINTFNGYNFDPTDGLETKKGEAIRAYNVSQKP